MTHETDRWWCFSHKRFASGARGCEPTQGGILLVCEAVPLDDARELIRHMADPKLIGLVMLLTGGTANPALVKGHIERVRSTPRKELVGSP